MARFILIANWKMNPLSKDEARMIFDRTKRSAEKLMRTEIVIAPPFPFISLFRKTNKTKIGAQDVFWEDYGAFTGEVSPHLLKDLGVEYAIVGHSERRKLGESDEMVSKKIRASIKARITPVVCVGESVRDHHGDYLHFISNQIKHSLKPLKREDAKYLIIAYEPIWAIGKSAKNSLDPILLHEMVLFIRKVVSDLFGRAVGDKIRIIYGGSVEVSNAEDLIKKGGVDGFLVGHASLKPDFKDIMKAIDASKTK